MRSAIFIAGIIVVLSLLFVVFNSVMINDNNIVKKDKNISMFKDNLKSQSSLITIFNSDSVAKPSEGIKKFMSFIKDNIDFKDKSIMIDISTFTKPYLFLLLKVMKEIFNIAKIYVIYTSPEKYKEPSIESGKIILTEGLDRVESIPGFTGNNVYPIDALIIILGFANLIADGFAMSVGSYLSTKSERDNYLKHKKIENWEIMADSG